MINSQNNHATHQFEILTDTSLRKMSHAKGNITCDISGHGLNLHPYEG